MASDLAQMPYPAWRVRHLRSKDNIVLAIALAMMWMCGFRLLSAACCRGPVGGELGGMVGTSSGGHCNTEIGPATPWDPSTCPESSWGTPPATAEGGCYANCSRAWPAAWRLACGCPLRRTPCTTAAAWKGLDMHRMPAAIASCMVQVSTEGRAWGCSGCWACVCSQGEAVTKAAWVCVHKRLAPQASLHPGNTAWLVECM
jgi:hypothetical protein